MICKPGSVLPGKPRITDHLSSPPIARRIKRVYDIPRRETYVGYISLQQVGFTASIRRRTEL